MPWVRLVRLTPLTLIKIDAQMSELERSQTIPFMLARTMRILYVMIVTLHSIACIFLFATRQSVIATHYRESPWKQTDEPYLRSMTFALMSLTTVGHIEDEVVQGAIWELAISAFIVVIASVLYIWMTANFTTMMLRVYKNLEDYRIRISQVESYLKRYRVRPSLARLVRQHVRQAHENAGKDDDVIIQQLPRSLRRELMIDINMRTLRRAPFFVGSDHHMVSMVCSMLSRVTFMREELIHEQYARSASHEPYVALPCASHPD